MANVCYNWIEAFGDAGAIKKLENELDMNDDMYSLEAVTNKGDSITISCETRWAPPEEWLQNISKEYGVVIECEYSECGANIAGKLSYENGGKIMDLEFTYLEGKYHFMDWFEFVEMEVVYRLDDADSFEDFIEDFDFCNEQEIEELTELYYQNAN